MPKASEVAAELRNFADCLDKNPDAEITSPSVYMGHTLMADPKPQFMALAKILPRPLAKKYTDSEFTLSYESPALDIKAYARRDKVCRIVEPARPAVYDCEPFLSADDEAELEAVHV